MWTLICAVLLSTTPPVVEAHTLSGEVLSGTAIKLDTEQLTLETAKGPVSVEVNRLADLSPKSPQPEPKAPSAAWIDLVDGSSLTATEYTVHEGRARIVLRDGQTMEVPTGDIACVRLQPSTEASGAQWSQIRDNGVESDLLVVSKDQSLDYHRGVLREVNNASVQFEVDGEVLPVKRGKVFGLIYYHPRGREIPEAICRLTDTSGSQWAVRTIRLDGENLAWTTPLGVEQSRPLGTLARLDFSQGKIVYLSDLEPESVRWTPYFGNPQQLPFRSELFAPRRNVGLDSRPLEMDGKTYAKGLALHSRTEMVYRLPGQFRWLRSEVGIDDGVRPRGNVRLIVRGDDRVLADMTVAGSEPPKPLEVDLQGVRRLSILVDFGDDLDVADHLDLGDARIVK
jgi:hypothetical protein